MYEADRIGMWRAACDTTRPQGSSSIRFFYKQLEFKFLSYCTKMVFGFYIPRRYVRYFVGTGRCSLKGLIDLKCVMLFAYAIMFQRVFFFIKCLFILRS